VLRNPWSLWRGSLPRIGGRPPPILERSLLAQHAGLESLGPLRFLGAEGASGWCLRGAIGGGELRALDADRCHVDCGLQVELSHCVEGAAGAAEVIFDAAEH